MNTIKTVFRYILGCAEAFFPRLTPWIDRWYFPPLAVEGIDEKIRLHCGDDVKNRRAMMRIAQKYLARIGRNVRFHPQNFKVARPIDDGEFHIHLWATPRDMGKSRVPNRVFRLEIPSVEPAIAWSGIGTPIYCPSSKWIAAELVGDSNLYVYFDLDGLRTLWLGDRVFLVLTALLEKTLDFLEGEPEGREQARTTQLEAIHARHEQALFERSAADLLQQTARAEELAQVASARHDKAGAAYASAIQSQLLAETDLRVGEVLADKDRELFTTDFESLLELPAIESVSVLGRRLEIITSVLDCYHPRTEQLHRIGRFRIEIFLDGSKGGVKWFNLLGPKTMPGGIRLQAPNVREDGSAWSLEDTEIFVELFMERSYSVVASLAIQFIENIDLEAFGVQFLDKWPVVTEGAGV